MAATQTALVRTGMCLDVPKAIVAGRTRSLQGLSRHKPPSSMNQPNSSSLAPAVSIANASHGAQPASRAWMGLLAGEVGPQRDAVARLLFMLPSYICLGVLLGVAVYTGLARAQEARCLFAYFALGYIGFYGVVRTGLSARWPDPALVFPNTCFNLTLVVLAYTLIPLTRGLVVQWLCLLILFDMRRLSGRQVLVAAALAYGLLIAAMLTLRYMAPDQIDMAAESVNIVMACVTVCTLLAVTRVARRVHEQRKAQQIQLAETVAKLDELAMRDGLTGVYNRRYTQALLEKEARRQVRNGRPFCVALLDIDHFKQVNDRFGHAVGDAVLRDVARLVSSSLGPGYALGRWGGEEFLVLLPGCTPAQATPALQAAASAVREHRWDQHAPGLTVSFSGGVSLHQPVYAAHEAQGGALSAEAQACLMHLLERADRALYAAKSAGRDRILTEP
jgi:diguanylate cyclase